MYMDAFYFSFGVNVDGSNLILVMFHSVADF